VARRLDRGGIAAQWLPIYELTPLDLATVVRSWNEVFPHVLVWMTYYDTVLIGSNEPIVVDEDAIARRLSAAPKVKEDMELVRMGTAKNLLEFFLMGNMGAKAFGSRGALNTDDNLWLEFSAPASQGRGELQGVNVQSLSQYRENLFGYLTVGDSSREEARQRWTREFETARIFDKAHAQFLLGRPAEQVVPILGLVEARDRDHGPLKFLQDEQEFRRRSQPALVADAVFPVRDGGDPAAIRISAVRQFISREWVLTSFVDNERREIYGQRYLEGSYADLEDRVSRFSREVLAGMTEAVTRAESLGPGGRLTRTEVKAILQAQAERDVGKLPSAAMQ
jgi:spermidine synthase